MRAFFVGLLVVVAMLLLSVVAVLLLPFIVVLGFFLKWIITIVLAVLAIWLIGKVTLFAIDSLKTKDNKPLP